jgi:hypothetical protein
MVSERNKNIGIGSVVTFVISLGTAIPGFGLILGPLFTFGGGLAGGSVGGFLEGGGAAEGAKVGLLVALIGGVTSSVVAVTGGTLINAVIATSDGSGSSAGSWLVIAAIGFISGLAFTFIGGLIGGSVAGAIRGD